MKTGKKKLKFCIEQMFALYGKTEPKQFLVYFEFLKEEAEIQGYDEVCRKIKLACKTYKFGLPTVAVILDNSEAENLEVSNFVDLFFKTCNNNFIFEPIPDAVYTVKSRLGKTRCENVSQKERPFLRKEVAEEYKHLKRRNVKLIQDPLATQYKRLPSGTTCLSGGGTDKALITGSVLRQLPKILESFQSEKLEEKHEY